MLNSEVLLRISKEVGAPVSRVETTIKLLEEGGTVPFIARYRKEATGNLDAASGAEILQILRTLVDGGRTVVLITHDKEVANHADRVLSFSDGRMTGNEIGLRGGRDAGEGAAARP